MFAVRVVPIVRGPLKEELTFFSRERVPVGSIVSAPIRKRMVPALAVDVVDVREEKLDIKKSDFALRKLGDTEARCIFSEGFMRAAGETALYHATTTGKSLVPLTFAPILASADLVHAAPAIVRTSDMTPDILVLQAESAERVGMYRNLARECFARKRSLMIIVPSLIELETLYESLRRGIEGRTLVFSSEVRKRALVERWNTAVAADEPLLVIGTPPTLSLPLATLDTLVVERESAKSYRSRENPYIDFRRAAELVAKNVGARLILSDFPNRVETRARVDNHTAEDLTRPQMRLATHAHTEIIDNRTRDTMKRERRTFAPISEQSVSTIAEYTGRGERAVVFAARKGIAPLTVCNDCGTPVADPATGTPMVLHKTPSGNMFISHRSGALLPANTTCRVCGGWNLVTLGVGVDRVHDELKKRFPKTPLFLLTAETAKTHHAANKIRTAFYGSAGGILVGTERMLPYLTEPVAVSAVASIDSMLSLSAWRAHEQALTILFALRERTTDVALIETRRPDTEVMKTIASGNPMDFYRAEIAERKEYGYPPFATFIGLAWHTNEKLAALLRKEVLTRFKHTDLVGPLPPEIGERGRVIERAVIRVPEGTWPNARLAEALSTLPHEIAVTIDPDEIV